MWLKSEGLRLHRLEYLFSFAKGPFWVPCLKPQGTRAEHYASFMDTKLSKSDLFTFWVSGFIEQVVKVLEADHLFPGLFLLTHVSIGQGIYEQGKHEPLGIASQMSGLLENRGAPVWPALSACHIWHGLEDYGNHSAILTQVVE